MKDQEHFRRIAFWAGIATAATLILQFAVASGSSFALLGAVAAVLGAAFVLTGPRPESVRELRRNRLQAMAVLAAFGIIAAVMIALRMPDQVIAALALGMIATGALWGAWRQFARRRR